MSFFYLKLLSLTLIISFCLYNIKNNRIRQYLLLAANYIFYAYLDLRFLLLLILTSVIVYVSARKISQSSNALYFGISVPLLFLFLFKYLEFLLISVFTLFGIKIDFNFSLILPIGISFYTFMCISYLLDVYKKKIEPQTNFVPLALYISFFPTIVSGPITKARDIICKFVETPSICIKDLQIGIQIFIIGCLKKVVLADRLAVFVDDVYYAPLAFDSLTVWLAVISYSFQLYFDFSGYSDMAIGCARCLGFQVSENFNLPYIARNISEFWKRWHISLSAWFQEYLYIPLGGSYEGTFNTYRNLIFTMLICGLWHGAAWKFVLWGGIHGVLLCLHRYYNSLIGNRFHLPSFFSVLLTFFSVSLCWVFFRGTDIHNIFDVLYRLFVWQSFGVSQLYIYSLLSIVLFGLISFYSICYNRWQGFRPTFDIKTPKYFFVFCVEILFLLGFAYIGGSPFVYAQF